MRRIISFLLIFMALAANARQISLDEAQTIASEFFNHGSQSKVKKAPRRAVRASSSAENHSEPQPYYIFIAADNAGFVIISGNTCSKKILGYSDCGSFDFNNLPPQLESLLQSYAKAIANIDSDCGQHDSWNSTAQQPQAGKELRTALWDQNAPFSNLCPNGYPTGCSATATAILMKYYNWPQRGNGVVGYAWEDQWLETDLSKTEFKWDLMRDEYIENEYSDEEANAVAELMRNVGYVLGEYYEADASYAGINAYRMNKYFNYAPRFRFVNRKTFTHDKLWGILTNEINESRPILVSGSTPLELPAHDYVCDGYAEGGYLHYNFGWSGYMNGYYTLDVNESHYDDDIEFLCGISPDDGTVTKEDCLVFSAGSWGDFRVYSDNKISHSLYLRQGLIDIKAYFGLAIEHIETHEVYYQVIGSWNWMDQYDIPSYLEVTMEVADGEYLVYPVVRFENHEWEKIEFNEFLQSSILMTVTDGIKSLQDVEVELPLDPGKVDIDNIFYILNPDDHTATVTNKNKKGGNYNCETLVIPEEIDYNGVKYSVTKIGEYAFKGASSLQNLILPKTLQEICQEALCETTLQYVNFEDLVNLFTIHMNAFGVIEMEQVIFPENLISIGRQAMSLPKARFVKLPEKLFSMDDYCLGASPRLRSIQVSWDNPEFCGLTSNALKTGFGCNGRYIRNVYIPTGKSDLYREHYLWGNYNLIEGEFENIEGQDYPININGLDYILDFRNKTAILTTDVTHYEDINSAPVLNHLVIPSMVEFNGTKFDVVEIDSYSLRCETVNLSQINNLKTINSRASSHNIANKSLNIPNGVEYLGDEAFEWSRSESIVLPSTLKHVGDWAFRGMENLSHVHIAVEDPREIFTSNNAFDSSNGDGPLSNVILYVPKESLDLYKMTQPWCKFHNILPCNQVSNISLSTTSIKGDVGECLSLPTVTIYPQDASVKDIMYSISDYGVADIIENSIVLLKEGVCSLIAEATDGSNQCARCTITVGSGADIDDICIDKQILVRIYSTSGILLFEGIYSDAILNEGIYIVATKEGIYKRLIK